MKDTRYPNYDANNKEQDIDNHQNFSNWVEDNTGKITVLVGLMTLFAALGSLNISIEYVNNPEVVMRFTILLITIPLSINIVSDLSSNMNGGFIAVLHFSLPIIGVFLLLLFPIIGVFGSIQQISSSATYLLYSVTIIVFSAGFYSSFGNGTRFGKLISFLSPLLVILNTVGYNADWINSVLSSLDPATITAETDFEGAVFKLLIYISVYILMIALFSISEPKLRNYYNTYSQKIKNRYYYSEQLIVNYFEKKKYTHYILNSIIIFGFIVIPPLGQLDNYFYSGILPIISLVIITVSLYIKSKVK